MRWDKRIQALFIASVFLLVAILFSFLAITFQVESAEELEYCSIFFSKSTFALPVAYTIIVTSITFYCFHLIMRCFPNRVLKSQFTILDIVVALIGVSISLTATIFSRYKYFHFINIFLLSVWAFFIQIFLQSKTNFGLFSSVSSASFTLLTSIVKCIPETPSEIAIFILGFVSFTTLYYLHAKATYRPNENQVQGLFNAPPTIRDLSLCLRRVIEDSPQFRAANSNSLLFVRNFDNNCELIPYSSIGPDLRRELLRSGGLEWRFLKYFYILTQAIDPPLYSSFPPPTPPLPPPAPPLPPSPPTFFYDPFSAPYISPTRYDGPSTSSLRCRQGSSSSLIDFRDSNSSPYYSARQSFDIQPTLHCRGASSSSLIHPLTPSSPDFFDPVSSPYPSPARQILDRLPTTSLYHQGSENPTHNRRPSDHEDSFRRL